MLMFLLKFADFWEKEEDLVPPLRSSFCPLCPLGSPPRFEFPLKPFGALSSRSASESGAGARSRLNVGFLCLCCGRFYCSLLIGPSRNMR